MSESFCVYVSIYPSLWWEGDQRLCHASILFHCAGILAGRCRTARGAGQGSSCRAEFLVQRNFLPVFKLNQGKSKKYPSVWQKVCNHSNWGVRADWNPALGLTESHQSQSWTDVISWYSPVKKSLFFLEDPQAADPGSPIALFPLLVSISIIRYLTQWVTEEDIEAPHLKHWSLQSIPRRREGFYTPSLLKLSFHHDSIYDGMEGELWSATTSSLLSLCVGCKKAGGSFPVRSSLTPFLPALFPGFLKRLNRYSLTASG